MTHNPKAVEAFAILNFYREDGEIDSYLIEQAKLNLNRLSDFGFVLMPIKPTFEMTMAMIDAPFEHEDNDHVLYGNAYAAAIQAYHNIKE